MMKSKKPVLLVEDDQVDAMTTERAFKELKITNKVEMATNGEEALTYLKDDSKEKPCLILLDLNMPRMNGIEFLKEARNIESLKKIPVVVLTTSRDEEDKVDTFKLGVAGYMIKPVDYRQFVEVVKTIDIYWTISEVPFEN